MSMIAHSFSTKEADSFLAGQQAAQVLKDKFHKEPMAVLIAYATINHDAKALLEGISQVVGGDCKVIGCSVQGIMVNNYVSESGYELGVMGLGGDGLKAQVSIQENIQQETGKKAGDLAKSLSEGEAPKTCVLIYDPLCGVDAEIFVNRLGTDLGCPVVGGAAGHTWGPIVKTFQFFGQQVYSNSAIALTLSGDFSCDIGICTGCSPVGIEMTVTQAEGTKILTLDGRPALEVWREMTAGSLEMDTSVSWAIGIQRQCSPKDFNEDSSWVYVVRAAFAFDEENKALVFQAAIPTGTRVMFQHRTVEAVLEGTNQMAKSLQKRLQGKTPWAVLGFECGARTSPFLGQEGTLSENQRLQTDVAPEAAWLGMFAWGEVAPFSQGHAFFNFTYPLLVLSE